MNILQPRDKRISEEAPEQWKDNYKPLIHLNRQKSVFYIGLHGVYQEENAEK